MPEEERKKATKRLVKVGEVEINLDDAVRDLKGEEIETIAVDILQEMGERRLKQWKPKLNIYAHAADISTHTQRTSQNGTTYF
jgi:hypothetical protein